MFSHALRSVDALAAHLPFHLNDSDRVNEVFRVWRKDPDSEARRTVDIWTYCFIWRYFTLKFMRETSYDASDLETLIEAAYRKVERARDRLGEENRYASWVSVICKNTYLNYMARRHLTEPLDEEDGAFLSEAHGAAAGYDAGLVLQEVQKAIDRLPPALQEVARLRLLENKSYAEIGQVMDKPLPTLRAYVNKALKRLRQDPNLLRLMQ